jgi:predicted MPP superfamily phosphohydrolase
VSAAWSLAPVVRRRLLRVPPTWPALSILHLSDLHLRRSDPRSVSRQAAALARLPVDPDLVCVTGDLCEQELDAPLVAEVLSAVRSRLGTFVILGNHEYGTGAPSDCGPGILARWFGFGYRGQLSSGVAEGEAIARTLGSLGVCVLHNRGVRLDSGDQTLWLAGVDSGWAGRANIPAALDGVADGDGVLVMIHEPELAVPAVQYGADLVLAGHTHGGQIRLPLVGALHWHRRDKRLTAPSGVQVIGGSQLHISAGMGQLVPFRWNCPPELVWLDCVPIATRLSASLEMLGCVG